MKLTYYKGKVHNFGDGLNAMLWEGLLAPGFLDEDDSQLFLGVGSILFDRYAQHARKIVAGSGYGGYTPAPVIDDTWQVAFLRGPLTARALKLPVSLAVSDAAILSTFLDLPCPPKKHHASFIPHWESIGRGCWEAVCQASDVHFLSPTGTPDAVIAEIRASRLVISESLHGVILADTFRVPWIAVEPITPAHRMKWMDWSASLDVALRPQQAPASSVRDFIARTTRRSGQGKLVRCVGDALSFANPLFVRQAARDLQRIRKQAPQLSADAVFTSRANQALECLAGIEGVTLRVQKGSAAAATPSIQTALDSRGPS
jgi:succinoglycan biosynthesis protein ExoV